MMKSAPLLLALLLCILSLFTTVVHAGTNAEGLAYLAAKGKEEGVVTLPSGLLYKEIRPGNVDGKTPTLNSPCECDYAGTLIDGTEFDSSYKRGQPLTFAPNQVIKGWTEAMQLMKEGAKWELYIPSELAYGDNGAGGSIPGGAVLIFTLELLKVKGDFVKSEMSYFPTYAPTIAPTISAQPYESTAASLSPTLSEQPNSQLNEPQIASMSMATVIQPADLIVPITVVITSVFYLITG